MFGACRFTKLGVLSLIIYYFIFYFHESFLKFFEFFKAALDNHKQWFQNQTIMHLTFFPLFISLFIKLTISHGNSNILWDRHNFSKTMNSWATQRSLWKLFKPKLISTYFGPVDFFRRSIFVYHYYIIGTQNSAIH